MFLDELCDLLVDAQLSDAHYIVVCGDLNCPGQCSSSIDSRLAELLHDLNFTQHVKQPTRDNNILDILASSTNSVITSVTSGLIWFIRS